ncbi:DUF4886 domain-containing protein [Fluviicola taffensis]|uniref:SGNH/GDSL hydrolase family protein n=1 Tax=Fluviicola taffensis TaxID=191579 RepID=UPI0031376E9F
MHKRISGRTSSHLFVLLLVVLCFSCSQSKKTTHILFVGNSYTYRNNMPKLFEEIARSKGEQLSVSHITRGKYTFYLQSKRKKLYHALHDQEWDVIVLQGSSRDMLRDSARFKKRTYPALDKMLGMIQKNQKAAKVYFYMTWPYRKGDPKTKQFSDPDSMLEAVAAGYSNLRDRYKVPVIPVGKVWRSYHVTYPEANLYLRDNSHPSYEGSYLVACTMYSAIYGKSPEGADQVAILNQNESTRIQRFINKQYRTSEFQFYLKDSI